MATLWSFLDSSASEQQTGDAALEAASGKPASGAHSGCICALPDWGIIRVQGADAVAFLHSQLSNDVQGLEATESRLAAYCNPKGRTLALVRLLRTDESLLLLTHKALIDSLIRRLRMFVLRSKVTLDDASEAIGVIGLYGAEATPPLEQIMGAIPEPVGAVHSADAMQLIRLGHTPDRFVLAVPAGDLPEIWAKLADTLPVVTGETWRLFEIRAGMPTVISATQEAFVPQMLNLEPLQGISYQKGCYPGQEVIARMHYLGKLKRRMYRLHTRAELTPSPGETVRAAEGGKDAGTVVSAAATPDGGHELLAVLRTELAEGDDDLVLDDTPLQILELPYAFEAEAEANSP